MTKRGMPIILVITVPVDLGGVICCGTTLLFTVVLRAVICCGTALLFTVVLRAVICCVLRCYLLWY